MLAARLQVTKNLGPDTTVLVIGDGITASMTASMFCRLSNGPKVLVCKRDSTSRLNQRNCLYRFVDPYIYDWPHIHYIYTHYPLQPSATIAWDAALAYRVATRILASAARTVNAAVRGHLASVYDFYTPTCFRFDPNTKKWIVKIRQLKRSGSNIRLKQTLDADVVVIAGGMGLEDDKEGSFRSIRFWDTYDPLFATQNADGSLDRKSINVLPVKKSVLIIGGADGALQDFVYLLTGISSARVILDNLTVPKSLAHELQSVNSAYLRRYIGSTRSRDSDVFSFVHEKVDLICQRLWNEKRIAAEVRKMLLPFGSRHNVQVACRNWYFSNCFPLNRILAGLFARAIGEEDNAHFVPFRMNVKISGISSMAPATYPLHDAQSWAQYPAKVSFLRSNGSRPSYIKGSYFGSLYTDDLQSQEYDRILLRKGSPKDPFPVRACVLLDRVLHCYARKGHHEIFSEHDGIPLTKIASRETRQVTPFYV